MANAKSKDPRKAAKQERSRATLDAIFDAMDRVVAKAGVEEFSIVEVARDAGIGRASIYDFFATREALVAAWEERVFGRELARVGERLAFLVAHPPGIEATVVELIDLVTESFAQQTRRFKYTERFEVMAQTAARGELTERIVAMFAAALAHHPNHGRIRLERLDAAARIIVHSVLHVARTLAVRAMSLEEHRLHRRELATMIYRYVLHDPQDVLAARAS